MANKFGAHTNYESILKICWYESAYSMFISLALSIIQVILILIIQGLSLDIYADETLLYIISFTYIILEIVLYIWYFWLSFNTYGTSNRKGRSSNIWYWAFGIFNSSSPYWYFGRHGYACYI